MLDDLESQSQTLESSTQGDTPGSTGDGEAQIPAWQAAVYESRQQTLRAQEDARVAREQLEQERVSRTNPPLQPLEPGAPFNDPNEFLRRITDHLDRQVAPLNDYVRENMRKDEYFKLKARVKMSNPGVAQNLAAIEGHIDNAFLSNPSLIPNEQTFMQVVQNVVGGLYLSGGLNRTNNQPNNTPNPTQNSRNVPNNQPTPPNMRPSGRLPNPPSETQAVDPNSFTEYERRLARENKMSLEEFALMRDTPEDQIARVWKEILTKRKATAAAAQNGGR